jgi:hypothetical protein
MAASGAAAGAGDNGMMPRALVMRLDRFRSAHYTAHLPWGSASTIKEGWQKYATLDTIFALLFIPDAFLFPEPSQDLADIKRAE